MKPPLLPSPPTCDFVSIIFSVTFASPTLERKTVPPFCFMYFSTDMLVSWLSTKFLQPNSSALTTPIPSVTSGFFFSPLITITRRSPSRSKAKPMSLFSVFDIRSFSASAVGSGPLELFSSSLIVITSHPTFSNNCDENPLAAPPPISTVTLGMSGIFPMIFTASSI